MRDRRKRTALLALLAWLSLSPGGPPPEGLADGQAPPLVAEAPWTPEVPAVEKALRELRSPSLGPALGPLSRTIVAEARRAGFSPDFVLAVIRVESSGDPYAISSKGALGLMQLLPATGEAVARSLEIVWKGPETLFDPVTNVRLGVAYLARLRARYGNLSVALAAYNWGPTRVSDMIRRSQPIPVAYSRRVLRACRGSTQAAERPI
jgi:soluble lytic murein transglycosylase-like protein